MMRTPERMRPWREPPLASSMCPSICFCDRERESVVPQRHRITRDDLIRFVCEIADFIPDLHSEIVTDVKIELHFTIEQKIPRKRHTVVFDRIAVADVFTGDPHAEPTEQVIVKGQTDRRPDIPRFQ